MVCAVRACWLLLDAKYPELLLDIPWFICVWFCLSNLKHFLVNFVQQSAAFKILRTRLKTVPSYSFKKEQLRRTSSGSPYSQNNHGEGGSHFPEDGNLNESSYDIHNGINFSSRLQHFMQIQHQHRLHLKSQTHSCFSSTSSTKVCCASYHLLNLLIQFESCIKMLTPVQTNFFESCIKMLYLIYRFHKILEIRKIFEILKFLKLIQAYHSW